MGTSSRYGGTPPQSPLVPSWVGELGSAPAAPIAAPSVAPGVIPPGTPNAVPASAPGAGGNIPPSTAHPLPPPATPGRFTSARSNFTAYAKSGGSGNPSRGRLGKALSHYVRSGSGGRKSATQRMAPSRTAAANIGSFVRQVQQDGGASALGSLNCADLVGKPAGEALGRLVDAFCPAGGPVDESIARQAFQETVIEWASKDLPAIEEMTSEQWQEFMIEFVSQSITHKICADIGTKAIEIAQTPQEAIKVQRDLISVIDGCVRKSFDLRPDGFRNMSDSAIKVIMDSVYERAWGFIEDMGESEQ